jgi:DNA-binding XRE family transcriptional regulator
LQGDFVKTLENSGNSQKRPKTRPAPAKEVGRSRKCQPLTAELGALGDLFRLRRKALGLTVDALAAKCGFSAAQIYYVESGRHAPLWTTVEKLAAALELTIKFVGVKNNGS